MRARAGYCQSWRQSERSMGSREVRRSTHGTASACLLTPASASPYSFARTCLNPVAEGDSSQNPPVVTRSAPSAIGQERLLRNEEVVGSNPITSTPRTASWRHRVPHAQVAAEVGCSTCPTTGCSSDYVDGAAVVAGWLLLHGPLGVLVLAATLPEARRRGYWAAMLRRRLHAAEGRAVAAIFGDMSGLAPSATGSCPTSPSRPSTG